MGYHPLYEMRFHQGCAHFCAGKTGPESISAFFCLIRVQIRIDPPENISVPGKEKDPVNSLLLCERVDISAVTGGKKPAVYKTELKLPGQPSCSVVEIVVYY